MLSILISKERFIALTQYCIYSHASRILVQILQMSYESIAFF
jgi:hypothetical protein